MQRCRVAASISPMITEPITDRTLHVSIVLYQSTLPLLRKTLKHLIVAAENALSNGALSRVIITLVDNDSGHDYCRALRDLVEPLKADTTDTLQLTIVELNHNWGFGAGHNHALLESSAEHLLILNPDVELAPDAISTAAMTLRESSTFIALNPRSARESGEPEFLCKRYPTVPLLLLRGVSTKLASTVLGKQLARYEYRDRPRDEPHEVILLSGACIYCRRSVFADIGGFDSRYFLYFEDFDLSLRMRAHGQLRYLPQMQIVHHGGNAARKGWRHIAWFIRSALRFFKQHGFRVS